MRNTELSELGHAVRQLKRGLIVRALRRAGGNKTKAAAALGVTRPHLYFLIRTLGVKI